jgi:hypothetical protein
VTFHPVRPPAEPGASIGIAPSGDTTGATDQANIAAAISATSVAWLQPGTFYIAAPVAVTTAGAVIRGAGQGITSLLMVAAFSGAAAITVTGADSCLIQDLSIGGTGSPYSANPAAAGIQVSHASHIRIVNVRGYQLNGYAVEVLSDGTADSYFPVLDDVHAFQCASGVHFKGSASSDHNMGAYLSNSTLEQCQSGDALFLEDVFDSTIVNVEATNTAGTGSCLHIKGTGGAHYITNVDMGVLVSAAPFGQPTMLVESSGAGSPANISVADSLLEYGTPNVKITQGSAIVFTGCQFLAAAADGVDVSGTATDVMINGCVFGGNNFNGGASRYDLSWSASGNLLATGNMFLTPGGTGAGQVASAANPTAGTTWFNGNWFAAATPFVSGFPTGTRANIGYNPVGPLTPPGVPASTSPLASPFGVDCTVYITAGASTCKVTIGSTDMFTIASGGTGTVRLDIGQSVKLTYASAPTWQWSGD